MRQCVDVCMHRSVFACYAFYVCVCMCTVHTAHAHTHIVHVHLAPSILKEEDEWEDEQPSYMNLEEAEELQCGEPEDIYVNQESQSSSSGEFQLYTSCRSLVRVWVNCVCRFKTRPWD